MLWTMFGEFRAVTYQNQCSWQDAIQVIEWKQCKDVQRHRNRGLLPVLAVSNSTSCMPIGCRVLKIPLTVCTNILKYGWFYGLDSKSNEDVVVTYVGPLNMVDIHRLITLHLMRLLSHMLCQTVQVSFPIVLYGSGDMVTKLPMQTEPWNMV